MSICWALSVAFQALTSGKILQVVRATDGTNRSTTSTSFVDASISVTITPQKDDSAVLLIATFARITTSGSGDTRSVFSITDNSNNAISGAENAFNGINGLNAENRTSVVLIGYATPATTSAVTYKLRFRSSNASNTTEVNNTQMTGQLYAIEVSA